MLDFYFELISGSVELVTPNLRRPFSAQKLILLAFAHGEGHVAKNGISAMIAFIFNHKHSFLQSFRFLLEFKRPVAFSVHTLAGADAKIVIMLSCVAHVAWQTFRLHFDVPFRGAAVTIFARHVERI